MESSAKTNGAVRDGIQGARSSRVASGVRDTAFFDLRSTLENIVVRNASFSEFLAVLKGIRPNRSK